MKTRIGTRKATLNAELQAIIEWLRAEARQAEQQAFANKIVNSVVAQ